MDKSIFLLDHFGSFKEDSWSWANNVSTSKAGETSNHVNDSTASKIKQWKWCIWITYSHKAFAIPHPVTDKRIDDSTDNDCEDDIAHKLGTLGHCS